MERLLNSMGKIAPSSRDVGGGNVMRGLTGENDGTISSLVRGDLRSEVGHGGGTSGAGALPLISSPISSVYKMDPWTTEIISVVGHVLNVPLHVGRVGVDLVIFTIAWLYGKLVLEPLRIFYFIGPVLENKNPEDICAQISKITASEFTKSPEGMQMCQNLLERRFESYNATVITVLYFALLALTIIYILHRRLFVPDAFRIVCKCAKSIKRCVIGEKCNESSSVPKPTAPVLNTDTVKPPGTN